MTHPVRMDYRLYRSGYRALAAAIVTQAVWDLMDAPRSGGIITGSTARLDEYHRHGALSFLKSEWCFDLCQFLGLSRRRILNKIGLNHEMPETPI